MDYIDRIRTYSLDQIAGLQAKAEPDSEMYKRYSGELLRRQTENSTRAAEAAARSAATAHRASWAAVLAAGAAWLTILARSLGWLP